VTCWSSSSRSYKSRSLSSKRRSILKLSGFAEFSKVMKGDADRTGVPGRIGSPEFIMSGVIMPEGLISGKSNM